MPAQAAIEEGLEQSTDVAAESAAPQAAEAAATEGGAADFAAEGALPEVGKPETKIATEPTASDQAFGTDEVTPADRDFLLTSTMNRMAASVGPFVLACSNRREELHQAVTRHPEMVATLGRLAFGNLIPGLTGKNKNAGGALTPSTSKLVSDEVGQTTHMQKIVEDVGKLPMQNFNLNFGAIAATETSEEFVDQLGTHVADGNEALRQSLGGKSNDDLAALCAAFDPASNTVSIFEEHLDHQLSLVAGDGPIAKPTEEEETELPTTKELAYVGDPGEGDKNQLAVVEKDPKESGEKQHKVTEMVPDEMKEMAISKHGEEPGTLYQDSMYRR